MHAPFYLEVGECVCCWVILEFQRDELLCDLLSWFFEDPWNSLYVIIFYDRGEESDRGKYSKTWGQNFLRSESKYFLFSLEMVCSPIILMPPIYALTDSLIYFKVWSC